MFSKKKEVKRHPDRTRNKGRDLSQFGLLDTDGMDLDINNMGNYGDDDDDESLEAELMAITSGKAISKPRRRPKGIQDMNALNALVAESIKDVSDEDDDDSDLENDSALLDELQQLTPEDEEMTAIEVEKEPSPTPPPLPQRRAPPPPQIMTDERSEESSKKSVVQILEERITAYNTALSISKTLGETSKIRRFERGLKTLQSLLKSAKNGKPINEEEIPPMVVTNTKRAPSPLPPGSENSLLSTESVPSDIVPSEKERPSEPQTVMDALTAEEDSNTEAAVSSDVLNTLTTRRDQYKQAALSCKRAGDADTAIKFVKIAKQFDNVIGALKSGQPVDLSQMPPPPPGFSDSLAVMNSTCTNNSLQTSALPDSSLQDAAPTEQPSEEPVDDVALFNAPSAPTTVLEALEQRLEKYQSSQKEAQEQGNSSKARRMGRIVKQYQDAIKMHKAGKPVAYDDLPAPPGFGPIPHENGSSASQSQPLPVAPRVEQTPHPAAAPMVPAHSSVAKDEPPSESSSNSSGPSGAVPPPLPPRQRPLPAGNPTSVKRKPQSLHDKQLSMLEEKQRLFREAALQAKKRGDIQAAKEYLRQSKGFVPMIQAAKCGLPVTMDSAPTPPQLQKEDSFEVVDYEDCIPQGDRDETFAKLEEELKKQISTCIRTSNHFTQLGDIGSSRKFRVLADNATKDLTALKHAFKRGDNVPRFHYQMKTYSIVQCFTDLTDNDLEVTIVRGINYSCSNPKEIDTYVKFEFPYPSDSPPHDRTSTVKDTNNPEYNRLFVLPINRKARAMARVFKRGALKFEVIAKGGFFRSDSLLGTVQVKLATLETKCLIHESFDLMDGRKPVGGKLEVKIRIREPLLTKQVEEINEKWLVIDQYK